MPIDLLNLDYDLGVATGTNAMIGGLILSLILICAIIMFPLYKRAYSVAFGLFIALEFLTVGLTWLNVYVLIITLCAVAGGLAWKFKKILT